MDPTDIEGYINDTLAEDAEQFGGSGETQDVPTHHVRVTDADLVTIVEGGSIETEELLLVRRHAWPVEDLQDLPDTYKFRVRLSDDAIRQLARNELVDYGIRNVGGANKFLILSCGGISDKLGMEKTPIEIEKERHPELRENPVLRE